MDLGLHGKTVIVTGGGSNTGSAICLGFAQDGSTVVIAEIEVKQAELRAIVTSPRGKATLFPILGF